MDQTVKNFVFVVSHQTGFIIVRYGVVLFTQPTPPSGKNVWWRRWLWMFYGNVKLPMR